MNSIQSALVRFLLKKTDIWNKPIQNIRKKMESIKAKGVPEGITVRKEEINGVPCEVFLCHEAKMGKAILYFHGGGFCLGIYNANREFVAGISKKTGANVYMPDYRLAPEHPFPAALEDAVAIYKGMLQKGYAANDLIVMGDSSGCALAVSALLVLKQSDERMPVTLAFITPLFDLAGRGETFLTRVRKDPYMLKDPLGIAKIYLGLNNPSSPMISPLYGELAGLPPVLIHAGDYDVFLSDAYRFQEKIEAAGGEIKMKVWKKMWHVFHMQATIVPESGVALTEICSYINEKFSGEFHISNEQQIETNALGR